MFTHDPAVPPPLRGLLAPTGKPHRVAPSPPCTEVARTRPRRAPASLLRVRFSAELSNQQRGAGSKAPRPEPGPPLAAASMRDLQLISIAPWAGRGHMVPEAREKPNTMQAGREHAPPPHSSEALLCCRRLWGPPCTGGTAVPARLRGLNTIQRPSSSSSGRHSLAFLPASFRGGRALPSDPVPTKGPLSMTKSPQRLPPTNGIGPAGALSETATRACRCFSPFLPNGPIRSSRCHINYLNLGDMPAASSETPFGARRPRIPH